MEIIGWIFYLFTIVGVCIVIGGLLSWMEQIHLAHRRRKFIADLGDKIWTSHK